MDRVDVALRFKTGRVGLLGSMFVGVAVVVAVSSQDRFSPAGKACRQGGGLRLGANADQPVSYR
jgi:hypothetical protein